VGKFLLVVVLFAALVYTVLWLLERRRGAVTPVRRTPGRPRPRPRMVAPDDDEEFLRNLNRHPRPDQGRDTPGD